MFPNAPNPEDGCELLNGVGEGLPKGVVDVCDGPDVPVFFASSEGESLVSKSALSGCVLPAGLASGLDAGEVPRGGILVEVDAENEGFAL